MDFVLALQFWHWLALGIVILILEMLGIGGFFLGMAVAALTTGALQFFFPELPWFWQIGLFSLLSIAFTLIYWKKFRRFNHRTEQPDLNSRAAMLIGRKTPLLQAVTNGVGKVQIADALWTVECARDLDVGAMVEVVAVQGMILRVEPVNARNN